MNLHRTTRTSLWPTTAALLAAPLAALPTILAPAPALAAAVAGTPAFIWSDTVSDRTTTYATARDPRDSVVFNGSYLARDVTGDTVTAPWNNVQTLTSATVARTAGVAGPQTQAQVQVSGNAGDFDARIQASASSQGNGTVLDANAGGRAGVGHWYVVQGATTVPISLRVDILFQGQLFARPCAAGNACDAGAAFSHSLGVIASPDDLVQETALQFNGAATREAAPVFGFPGTVPDAVFAADGQVHDVNVIVRSNPFAVTTNVPFRLNLSLNASAGSIGDGDSAAWIDFFDPALVSLDDFPLLGELSPSGFVVDLGVDPQGRPVVQSLDAAGVVLASANVPLPGTLALLGLGLAVAGMTGRRRGAGAGSPTMSSNPSNPEDPHGHQKAPQS